VLIVDTAPNADQTASLAARAADVVLIPCRPATFDLEAIETTLLLTRAANRPAYVILNAVPARSGIGREAAAGLTAQGARVAPVQLTHRAAFTHGVIDGRTAQEFEPEGKAAEEISAVYTWLCAWRQLRLLALDTRKSTQALGEEAVNLLFEKHGLNRSA
jgi:chromosome partitioning protein